jgi:hypothetical protein
VCTPSRADLVTSFPVGTVSGLRSWNSTSEASVATRSTPMRREAQTTPKIKHLIRLQRDLIQAQPIWPLCLGHSMTNYPPGEQFIWGNLNWWRMAMLSITSKRKYSPIWSCLYVVTYFVM